ncbi:MAG: hypothetical protein GX554_01465 [Elusimicrobia bacterium]|nr:hypothetical protein [Elusimicrobiota bacterium]
MKKKIQIILVVCGVLIATFLLNFLTSMKSPSEKMQELISQHRGVIILVKSGTEQDKIFLDALKKIRPELKGKAGIIITNRSSGFLNEKEEPPLMIILDAHGNLLNKFSKTIDERLLMESVYAIVTHSH